MRRLGRTVVSDRTAKKWRYEAKASGSRETDLAAICESPRLAYVVGVADEIIETLKGLDPQSSSVIHNVVTGGPVWLKDRPEGRVYNTDLLVPCRRCPKCLRAKARHWRNRASIETRAAGRTWFCTFTMRPERHARAMYEAIRYETARGNRWETLPPDVRFRSLCRFIRREWQLYIKRLRKRGAELRYLMIIERHSGGGDIDGMPHLHALVHEQGSPVRHRTLQEQWTAGFSNMKLVDDQARRIAYVCKYLTKDIVNRPFASLRYGQPLVV